MCNSKQFFYFSTLSISYLSSSAQANIRTGYLRAANFRKAVCSHHPNILSMSLKVPARISFRFFPPSFSPNASLASCLFLA